MAVTPLSYAVSELFPQPFSTPPAMFYDSTVLFFLIYLVRLKNLLQSPFCIAGPKYVCQRLPPEDSATVDYVKPH